MSPSTSSAPSPCRWRPLFGSDALAYRLRRPARRPSSPTQPGLAKLAADPAELPDLDRHLSTDGAGGRAEASTELSPATSAVRRRADTAPDDPALMIYTSGTTGPPKGALHGHRVLLGHLPGVELPHEFLPQPGDRLWTPADWAWAGGLLNVLLPASISACRWSRARSQKFDPEAAFALMASGRRAQRLHAADGAAHAARGAGPARPLELDLRTLGSAGEALGARDLRLGARRVRPRPINEFYGQTECNFVLGSCAALGVAAAGRDRQAGARPRVAVIDAGRQRAAGRRGRARSPCAGPIR